jgi:hypothetical protein
VKRFFSYIKHQASHKIQHLKWSSLKKTLKKHGLALVIIIVVWEIIEDILFPALFITLGNYVHPAFYAGAPAAWLLCLHWLAVPIMWSAWVKIKGGDAHDTELPGTCTGHKHTEGG